MISGDWRIGTSEGVAEGDEIDAASQAAAHLSSDLTIPTRMILQIERELAGREKPDAR